MSRRLCPFRKVTVRKVDDVTGRVVERERFRLCAEKFCMAYVYTAPLISANMAKNPDYWGCARLLRREESTEIL